MIHLLKFILASILVCTIGTILLLFSIILSIIYWNTKYMDSMSCLTDDLWDERK
jgi:hypothetical protein